MFGLLNNCLRTFGLSGLLIYLKLKFGNSAKLNLPGIKHSVMLRNIKADHISFREIFFKKEYDIELPSTIIPKIIIDAGANIGLTSVFFANRYPNAGIFSIEPDEGNYATLYENTKHYQNVTLLKSALWSKKDLITVVDKGYGERGFIVERAQGIHALQAISIQDIMEENNLTEIDILKMDIEGSEKEVFSENYEQWLPKTKCLVVELHDRMKRGTSKSVFEAVNKYDFSLSIRGENLIFINNRFIDSPS